MAAMRKALHRPWSPPVPKLGIKLVEAVFGVPSALSLEGAMVVPKAANDAGYKFQFATLQECIADLC
jgi:NAD dependent epimerase/dehydratase family enzyme